jgi:hypothetical protein
MSRDPGLDRWTTTESGEFVACIVVTDREDTHTAIEILIRGRTRDEVVGRLRSLGYHSIRFKGSHQRVPEEYVANLLASDHETLWRPFVDGGSWQPLS